MLETYIRQSHLSVILSDCLLETLKDVENKSLKLYSLIKLHCLNLVLTGSLVGDGLGEALMMTQQSACWLVSWCLVMWTVRSSWRHAAHHHLVATAPMCLADHKILASPWLRSNTCWVRHLPLLVSVSRRCRDPSGVTWFASAQILTFLSKFPESAVMAILTFCSLLCLTSLWFRNSSLLGCDAESHPKTKILNHNL